MMLSDADKSALERKLTNGMMDEVTLLLFVSPSSSISRELVDFTKTIAAFSPKITVQIENVDSGQTQLMKDFRVDRAPTLVLVKGDFSRIRYYGTPSGHETPPITDAIAELSRSSTPLSPKARAIVQSIKRKANIKIFVLTTCSFCPIVARHAYRAAIESSKVTAEIIDSQIFQDLALRHSVMGVPKMVLNDNIDITGEVQEMEFFQKLKDADISLIDSMYG